MKIQELVYHLYQLNHKYGNIDIMIMDKDLTGRQIDALATCDVRSPDQTIRKVLFIQDSFTCKRATSAAERNVTPVNTETNVIDLMSRKRILR